MQWWPAAKRSAQTVPKRESRVHAFVIRETRVGRGGPSSFSSSTSMRVTTRSQLALPPIDFTQLANSPLKNARQATRNNDPPDTMLESHHPLASHSADDGGRLSSKRPSSPLDASSAEQLNERASKKLKRDNAEFSTPVSLEQLNLTFSTTLPQQPMPSSMFPRAHSVPAHTSTPHLDLTSVPFSPSKSKGKERLRFMSVPSPNRAPNAAVAHDLTFGRKQDHVVQMAEVPPTTPREARQHLSITQMASSPLTPLSPQTSSTSGVAYEEMVVEVKQDDGSKDGEDDHSSQPRSRSKTPTPSSRIPRSSTALVALSAKKGVVSRMRPRTPSTPSTPIQTINFGASDDLPPETPKRGRPPGVADSVSRARTPGQVHSSTPGPSRSKTPGPSTVEHTRSVQRTPGRRETSKTPRLNTPSTSRARAQSLAAPSERPDSQSTVFIAAKPKTPARASSIPRPKTPNVHNPTPSEVEAEMAATRPAPHIVSQGTTDDTPPASITTHSAVPRSSHVHKTEPDVSSAEVQTGNNVQHVPVAGATGIGKRPAPRKRSASAAPEFSGGVRLTRSASLRQKENKKNMGIHVKEGEMRRDEGAQLGAPPNATHSSIDPPWQGLTQVLALRRTRARASRTVIRKTMCHQIWLPTGRKRRPKTCPRAMILLLAELARAP
ncbi:hypothetical protein BC835DRAFT_1104103 [Cytidiella melzeri]|nr:hypothetical protein BC835DRAFT_1104103 [Cytidiella melzeri]